MTTNTINRHEGGELAPASRFAPMSRRSFVGGLAAVGGVSALGLKAKHAQAATTVKMMGWQGYDEPFFGGDYLERNDIVVEMTYIGSIEDILIKLLAGGQGIYGLVLPNWAYIPSFVESGVLQPVDIGRVSNYGKIIPYFRDHSALIYKGKQYGVPFTWGGLPLMYDPARVVETPTSWRDVFKPEYKGKVAMIHDPLGIMEIWANVVTGRREGSTLMTHAELKEMIDLLIKMKKEHARAFFMSYGEAVDAFVRGEVVISAIGWEPMKLWAADKGGEIDYVYPKEGTLGFFDEACIPTDAPDLDVVYGLIDHLISVEGQVPVAAKISQGVVNPDAVPLLSETDRNLYPYDDIEGFASKAVMFPFPPTESDGVHATYDEWLEEYERLLKA